MRILVSPKKSLGDVNVLRSKQQSVEIVTDKEFCYPLSDEEYKNFNYDINIRPTLYAPMKKGTKVGEVSGYLQDKKIFSAKAVIKEDVKILPFKERLEYILNTESGC
jgi:D-alanyl-D-alanine carboxypeptidase